MAKKIKKQTKQEKIEQTVRPYLEHNKKYIKEVNNFIDKCAISNFSRLAFEPYLPFSRQFFVALMGGREKFSETHYKAITKALMRMRADKLRGK